MSDPWKIFKNYLHVTLNNLI